MGGGGGDEGRAACGGGGGGLLTWRPQACARPPASYSGGGRGEGALRREGVEMPRRPPIGRLPL